MESQKWSECSKQVGINEAVPKQSIMTKVAGTILNKEETEKKPAFLIVRHYNNVTF